MVGIVVVVVPVFAVTFILLRPFVLEPGRTLFFCKTQSCLSSHWLRGSG